MTSRILVLLTACGVTACALLSGCGQRGPLTLPEETPQADVQSEDETQDDEQENE